MRNMDPPVKSKMAVRGIYHGMGNEEPTKKEKKIGPNILMGRGVTIKRNKIPISI